MKRARFDIRRLEIKGSWRRRPAVSDERHLNNWQQSERKNGSMSCNNINPTVVIKKAETVVFNFNTSDGEVRAREKLIKQDEEPVEPSQGYFKASKWCELTIQVLKLVLRLLMYLGFFSC